MSKLSNRALADAVANIGVHEDGRSNSGKYVDQYLASVGLPPRNPWCCAFVSFRVHKAADELGVKTDWYKTGSCQLLYKWAKSKGLTHTVPQVGDVFLQWHPELNRYAHTGFVRSIAKDGRSFTTVEGNSNGDGSREGYEVCSNTRPIVKGKYVFVSVK